MSLEKLKWRMTPQRRSTLAFGLLKPVMTLFLFAAGPAFADQSNAVDFPCQAALKAMGWTDIQDDIFMGRKGTTTTLRWRIAHLHPALLNYQDTLGFTLLHYAAHQKNREAVQALLDAGADPTIAGKDRVIPLHIAAFNGAWALVRMLVGPTVPAPYVASQLEARTIKGDTALHIASAMGHVNVANSLIRAGALVDAENAMGFTSLHKAVEHDRPKIARTLLLRGANPLAEEKTAAISPIELSVFFLDDQIQQALNPGAPMRSGDIPQVLAEYHTGSRVELASHVASGPLGYFDSGTAGYFLGRRNVETINPKTYLMRQLPNWGFRFLGAVQWLPEALLCRGQELCVPFSAAFLKEHSTVRQMNQIDVLMEITRGT